MRKLSRAIEIASTAAGYFSGVLLLAVIGLVFAEVITRYVFRHALAVSDEYSGYALVAISLLGLAYTQSKGGHIRISFAVSRMPAKVANWLRVATFVIAFAWVTLGSVVSVNFVYNAFERNIKSNTPLLTLLAWPQLVIPIGFSLLALVLLLDIVKATQTIRSSGSVEATTEKESEK